MDGTRHHLRLWGVRGTVPTPSPTRLGHGGNTICAAAVLPGDEVLVLDAGSGLRLLGDSLGRERRGKPTHYHLFLSHYHFDHIEGLPYFHPLYDPATSITIHGFNPGGRTARDILESFICPPYFPITLRGVPAKVDYRTVDGSPFQVADVRVDPLPLHHPDGSYSYRLQRPGSRIVFATDHEHGHEETDRALVEFAEDADALLYDATYLPAEYEALRRGWGHSTWYAAVALAREARVRSLVLFHHHPDHEDADLEKILALSREEFPPTILGREGMEIPF